MKVKRRLAKNIKLSDEHTLLEMKDVLKITGYKSATSIENKIRQGVFPLPVQPDRKRYWILSEVEEWIDELKQKRYA